VKRIQTKILTQHSKVLIFRPNKTVIPKIEEIMIFQKLVKQRHKVVTQASHVKKMQENA
jgi:hypothetical protein